MIEIRALNKSFGKKQVLNNLNLNIEDNTIFGLIGINGAGKSTLLRLLAKVYDEDSGTILFDGRINSLPTVKKDIFFLVDDPHSNVNKNIIELLEFYNVFYDVNEEKFHEYLELFKLTNEPNLYKTNINKFSKGMKRQLYLALAMAIAPKYLLLDEAFDGLDPLSRLTFRKIILNLMEEKNMTVIISSHSLRELEDICDCYGLLDGGNIESSGSLQNDLSKYVKYQLAFKEDLNTDVFKKINPVSINKVGRVYQIVCEGEVEVIEEFLNNLNPLVIDKLTIDFEELFIIKVQKEGYVDEK